MIEFFKNIFSKPEDTVSNVVEDNSDIRFVLTIGNLIIGYLTIEDGFWIFQYSEEFKNQNKYRLLIGFSNKDKIYKSEVLWPFFKVRIPGLKQPMVKEILEAENIDKNNEALLLKRFGRRNMSSPYILTAEQLLPE